MPMKSGTLLIARCSLTRCSSLNDHGLLSQQRAFMFIPISHEYVGEGSARIPVAHPPRAALLLMPVTTTRPLELDPSPSASTRGDLVLHWPPNWTAVVFFAVLAGLHLCVCVPAFFHGRWEGYM